MPFNQKPQKFNANINTVEIGCGDKAIKLGGECTYPFYTFDAPMENAPKIGVEISDLGLADVPGIQEYYAGATTIGEIAKKAEAMEGADFVCLRLEGGDPNGENKSIEELIAVVKEVGEAVTCPLVVEGCKNVEKDSELLPKVAEALQGKNVLILSAREENYKAVGAAAGADALDLVGCHADAHTGAAEQQCLLALAAHHCVTGGHSHIGVVHAVGAVGAKVDILQTKLFQMCLDSLFQFKSAVVGGKCDGFCHGKTSFPCEWSQFHFYCLFAAASAARRSARSRSA